MYMSRYIAYTCSNRVRNHAGKWQLERETLFAITFIVLFIGSMYHSNAKSTAHVIVPLVYVVIDTLSRNLFSFNRIYDTQQYFFYVSFCANYSKYNLRSLSSRTVALSLDRERIGEFLANTLHHRNALKIAGLA